jgi:hypothetical protein
LQNVAKNSWQNQYLWKMLEEEKMLIKKCRDIL